MTFSGYMKSGILWCAHLDSEALYDAANSFSLTIDDVERYSFDEDKPTAVNFVGIYRATVAEEDLVRADLDWQPIVCSP